MTSSRSVVNACRHAFQHRRPPAQREAHDAFEGQQPRNLQTYMSSALQKDGRCDFCARQKHGRRQRVARTPCASENVKSPWPAGYLGLVVTYLQPQRKPMAVRGPQPVRQKHTERCRSPFRGADACSPANRARTRECRLEFCLSCSLLSPAFQPRHLDRRTVSEKRDLSSRKRT